MTRSTRRAARCEEVKPAAAAHRANAEGVAGGAVGDDLLLEVEQRAAEHDPPANGVRVAGKTVVESLSTVVVERRPTVAEPSRRCVAAAAQPS